METAKQGMTERENTHRVLRRPLSSGLKAVKQTHICQNSEPLLSKSGNLSRRDIWIASKGTFNNYSLGLILNLRWQVFRAFNLLLKLIRNK